MPLTYPAVLAILDLIVLILLYANYRNRVCLWPPPTFRSHRQIGRIGLVALFLVLLLAVSLRFGNLGYSEYVGDESDAVQIARQVVLGNGGELLALRKGPVQNLMIAQFELGTNGFNELAVRFPFALASALAVVALYWLVSGAWNHRLGLLAAAILALDGVVIGLSRLAQYHGVVLLTLVLIMYCLYRMSLFRGTALGRRYLTVALLLFGFALLAHPQTALMALPMAIILFQERRTCLSRESLRELGLTIAIVLVVLSIFYVPFIMDPYFEHTRTGYWQQRIGYGEGPFDNIAGFFAYGIFYNSVYYVVLTALLAAIGAACLLGQALPGRLKLVGYLAVFLAAVGVALSLFAPASLTVGDRPLTYLFFLPALILVVLPVGNERLGLAMLAWVLITFMACAFFLQTPALAYFAMAPAAALVAAVGLDAALRWLRLIGPDSRGWPAWVVLTGVFLFLAGYSYLLFVRQQPQYAMDFPASRSPLYWTPQTQMPHEGYFGPIRRSGWKALAVLYRQGELRGTYMSNAHHVNPEAATYLRDAPSGDKNPRYFFFDRISAQLTRVTRREKYPIEWVEERYRLIGQVRVSGEPRLLIFEQKASAGQSEVRNYEAEQYEPLFDRVDWLSAFRNRAEHQWDEANMVPLVQYLQAKEQPEGVVLVNDPELSEAFNYYYSGPMACLPMAAGQSDLESQVAGSAQVFLTVWNGRNVEATTQASRWLDSRFQRGAENDFGSLRVISYERPKK